MNLFVAIAIMIVWCSFSNSPTQTPSESEKQSLLEKRAVADIQRMLASELDTELPRLSFANWFRQIVGPGAGVAWQLSECGEQQDARPDLAGDMRACVEVNTILPDGRKVVVMVAVGTFKKGMTSTPVFYYGVIEQQEELYMVRRLRDLPELLRTPEILANRPGAKPAVVNLPAVDLSKDRLVMNDADMAKLSARSGGEPGQPITIEAAPPPPPPQVKPQPSTAASPAKNETGSDGVLQGSAIAKAQPLYPTNAKRFNASGPVEVQIVISETGRVVNARAVSGHPLLRDAAVEAARKWVFKPTTMNGVPVETQLVLTFVFAVPQ